MKLLSGWRLVSIGAGRRGSVCRGSALLGLYALGAFFSSTSLQATPLEIRIDARGILVVGLETRDLEVAAQRSDGELTRREGQSVLKVYAYDPDGTSSSPEPPADLPPLLGSYRIEAAAHGGLRFQPRFPPAPGLTLDVRFDGAAWDRLANQRPGSPTAQELQEDASATTSDAALRYRVPEPTDIVSAQVLGVRPSGQVPENLLRLYVHFSEPMSARHVLDHVALLDATGEKIPIAFVDVPGGLWDPERRRLTLFVHPGRVKRGVGPNQALGAVLEEGQSYTLRIGPGARDAKGRPLGRSFEASLEVGAADHRSPEPEKWRLSPPQTETAPLLVDLEAPADTALLARLLAVVGAQDRAVPVAFKVSPDGRRVEIEPRAPWPAGRYRLIVPAALEDSSGNRVDRLFEEAPASEGEEKAATELDFELSFTD